MTKDNSETLFRYLHGAIQNMGCELICINGMPEHIHLAVRLSPEISVSVFMREIKSGSSKWMKTECKRFQGFIGWATGYFCSTFSEASKPQVINYIDNQQVHHYNTNFYDEMKAFFERTKMIDRLDYFFEK